MEWYCTGDVDAPIYIPKSVEFPSIRKSTIHSTSTGRFKFPLDGAGIILCIMNFILSKCYQPYCQSFAFPRSWTGFFLIILYIAPFGASIFFFNVSFEIKIN